jgi:phage baseplate assembly protein W
MTTPMGEFLDVPFHVGGSGRTAATDEDDHIRDLIFQVLFTTPGERVNRPDFGCGLKQMVFMPNADALAAATQFLVHGALTRWLDTVIRVDAVVVRAVDERLEVRVVYAKRSTGERRADLFRSPGEA